MNKQTYYTDKIELLPSNHSFWFILGVSVLAVIMGVGIAVGVYQASVITMLAVLGLIFLIVAIGRPDISVIVFVFVLYLNLSTVLVDRGYPSIAKPFVALLAVILIIRWLVFKDQITGLSKPLLYVGIYTVLGSISLFFADDFSAAFTTLSVYLKDAVICFLIIALIQEKGTYKNVIRAILVAGILMGTVSLLQQLTGDYGNNFFGFAKVVSDTTFGSRMAGSVGDPNYYAQIMVVLLPLSIDRFFSEKRLILRLISAWAFMVCAFTVVYTYSRGAFLAASIALIIYGFRRRPNPTQLVFVVLIAFLVYQFLPSNYTSRIATLFDFLPGTSNSTYSDSSFRGRSSENMVAINMFLDNPILGVGMGNYNNKYQEYSRQLGVDFRNTARSAHSLYLEILAERGLLGILSFLTMIYYTFISLHSAEKTFLQNKMYEYSNLAFAVTIALAVYLVTALFLHDALIRYFWLLLGLAWSIPQLKNQLFMEELDVLRNK